MKKYRRPKVSNGQVKLQKHRLMGDLDICVFYGDDVPRCDRALVMHAFTSKRQGIDFNDDMKTIWEPSFIDELENRGYDIDTLRFSIDKKQP
tara:strand:+ start:498 stop:773 length:276 start_codon:yes stop_codon:yes gene_type:complete